MNSNTITKDKLTKMQCDLRQLNLKWADLLVNQIKEDKKLKEFEKAYAEEVNKQKIYNVFNGVVRDNGWIIFVYGQAKALLSLFERNLEKVNS